MNNSGEVLAATGTGVGCVYRTSFDFSPAKPPTRGDDECLGIGYWKPGMNTIAIIIPIGRTPQWITPTLAAQLRDWSKRE